MKEAYWKIGGVKYKVVEVKGLTKEYGMLGQILYDELLIKIDADLPQGRKEETLIHEVLHGIFFEAGFEEQDEDMINRVGKVLYQVIRNNLVTDIDYDMNHKFAVLESL
ncbi:ImmA/IrrE family metallo-endopeptidase [Bacillus cereus]|uniref:ImmA/IrrE family metallo-endopeptidase n=1 Tax=Bacillus cereus TaxID=1396 RepID=UPI000BFC3348|nr:ImmA/IrrE family metallo-endopeptidase [Bacillus cereus]MDM5239356.1 ImmA/IrrE family metallo-endopeptidase [Bacillus cereus]PGZ06000.1 ImmA/IrrE family metallo-endopeptidase [Bacillus cereus]